MEKVLIKAEKRTITGKKVKNIRLAGKVPAVIYGGKSHWPISLSWFCRHRKKRLLFLEPIRHPPVHRADLVGATQFRVLEYLFTFPGYLGELFTLG